MANIEYVTVKTTSDGGPNEPQVRWNVNPIEYTSMSIRPNYGPNAGNMLTTNYEMQPQRSESPERRDTVYFRETHSADNFMMYRQVRDDVCLWPTMRVITGFSYTTRMETGGARCIWMKNIGFSMVNKQGQDRRYWFSADIPKQFDTNWIDRTWDIPPEDRAQMQNYYFEGLWFRLTSEGGSGTTSKNSVWRGGNFKLKYFAGYEGNQRRWVVGTYCTRLQMDSHIIQEK